MIWNTFFAEAEFIPCLAGDVWISIIGYCRYDPVRACCSPVEPRWFSIASLFHNATTLGHTIYLPTKPQHVRRAIAAPSYLYVRNYLESLIDETGQWRYWKKEHSQETIRSHSCFYHFLSTAHCPGTSLQTENYQNDKHWQMATDVLLCFYVLSSATAPLVFQILLQIFRTWGYKEMSGTGSVREALDYAKIDCSRAIERHVPR